MTALSRMRTMPVRELANAPVEIRNGADVWRRWQAWIIAGPVLFALCCGLLVYAIGVTR